jgi:hypothetical protein
MITASAVFGFPIAGSSQPPTGTFPVIVIFREAVSLQPHRSVYHADDRAQANPEAWSYLDHGVAGAVQLLEARHGFRSEHVYSASIRGFSARLTARQIVDIESDPAVAYVEADGTMSIVAQTLPWGINRIDADTSSTRAGNGSGAVNNVNAYVLDTGVDASHGDLNVIGHVDFASGPNRDCNGHGTHVAGTAAARDNTLDVVGVSPGTPVTGVKVLGCGGTGATSGVIKGVDWVTANADKPAVANMSLGGGASNALDSAVKQSANSGVFYAVAAGNSGASACNESPARAGTHNGVATVAATNMGDNEPSWSNYGNCVEHSLNAQGRRNDHEVRNVDGLAPRGWDRRAVSVLAHWRQCCDRREFAQSECRFHGNNKQGRQADKTRVCRQLLIVDSRNHLVETGN